TTTDDLTAVLRNIVRISARTLGVGRASVWLFNGDRTEINEECLFADGRPGQGEPSSLSIHDCPRYFEALHDYRTLAVREAAVDPRTKELTPHYLTPKRVASKLDA